VREIRYTPTYGIRISRIAGLDEKALRAWADTANALPEKAWMAPGSTTTDQRDAVFTDEWLRRLP
jgi:hypothetical protein